jgi:hypothetical protein
MLAAKASQRQNPQPKQEQTALGCKKSFSSKSHNNTTGPNRRRRFHTKPAWQIDRFEACCIAALGRPGDLLLLTVSVC